MTAEPHADEPRWDITVSIPQRLLVPAPDSGPADDLFDLVASVAMDWEREQGERDWDVDICGAPSQFQAIEVVEDRLAAAEASIARVRAVLDTKWLYSGRLIVAEIRAALDGDA